ncbi:hypothetical protein BOTBODRAFT_178798 [Botryobasidium botryosum FD-172 SS1]|uniref:Secreted protein n=1 Tax=Botryobasidium botryosum (strain FD-172 SS1) TaxID=930990 RepID=A0A067M1U4_BOTB1|nr:hypothetical protein BOTBODRAFT_178798 [Botryobasidium botryosum FD-172 SS1]
MALFSWLAVLSAPLTHTQPTGPSFFVIRSSSLATRGSIFAPRGTVLPSWIRFQSVAPFSHLAARAFLHGLNRTVHRCPQGVAPALAVPSSALTAPSSLAVSFSWLPLAAPSFTPMFLFSQLQSPPSRLRSLFTPPFPALTLTRLAAHDFTLAAWPPFLPPLLTIAAACDF